MTTRAVSYPASVMLRARELRAAGHGIEATRRLLAADGYTVAYNTVRRWTEPRFDAQRRDDNKRAARTRRVAVSGFSRGGRIGPEWLLARMQVLERAGLSPNAIATVMRIDFPDLPQLTACKVAAAVRGGRLPKCWQLHFRRSDS